MFGTHPGFRGILVTRVTSSGTCIYIGGRGALIAGKGLVDPTGLFICEIYSFRPPRAVVAINGLDKDVIGGGVLQSRSVKAIGEH